MNDRASSASAVSDTGLILVLGGSGFIGSRLTSLLNDSGASIRIGDLKPSSSLPALSLDCDVRLYESVLNASAGVAAIVNLAAEHRDDVRPLSRYHETNVLGATNVCKAARAADIKKIVFTSSVAVYGFQPTAVDENGPFEPFNEYGRTKLAAEQVYREWASEDPSRSLIMVRPTVVFGEGNRGNVYNLLHQVAKGRFFVIGAGDNVKSMAYVHNLASFLKHCLTLGPGQHIYNYVDVPDMTMRGLVQLICRELSRPEQVRSVPLGVALAGGYVFDAIAKISGRSFPVSAIRIRKFAESTRFRADRVVDSGFRPPYTLREGLSRTIAHEFSNPKDKRSAPQFRAVSQ